MSGYYSFDVSCREPLGTRTGDEFYRGAGFSNRAGTLRGYQEHPAEAWICGDRLALPRHKDREKDCLTIVDGSSYRRCRRGEASPAGIRLADVEGERQTTRQLAERRVERREGDRSAGPEIDRRSDHQSGACCARNVDEAIVRRRIADRQHVGDPGIGNG